MALRWSPRDGLSSQPDVILRWDDLRNVTITSSQLVLHSATGAVVLPAPQREADAHALADLLRSRGALPPTRWSLAKQDLITALVRRPALLAHASRVDRGPTCRTARSPRRSDGGT